MKATIDSIFDVFESELQFYIKDCDTVNASLLIKKLEQELNCKKKECEEYKEMCINIADSLYSTITTMNNVLINADNED